MKTNRIIAGWLTLLALATLNLQPLTASAQPVIKVAAENAHTLFLKSDGSLWGMGYNYDGELGDGNTGTINYTNRPEQIVAGNVTAIAAGGYHSLFLKRDSSLWGMGYPYWGQLGDGDSPIQPVLWSVSPRTDCRHQCHGHCRRRFPQLVSQERRQPVGHGLQRLWPVGRRHLQQPQPARADCGQQRHGDCRRRCAQPVSQERRQSVGHGQNTMASWATALTTTPTVPSRSWPAMSRRLPLDCTQPVSQERWQPVGHGRQRLWPVGRRHLQQAPIAPNKLWPATSRRLLPETPQPVSQERWQSVGHGLQRLWRVGRRHLCQSTTGPNRFWPATSPRLPPEDGYSLFLKSDGSLWAMGYNSMASWATALTTPPTGPSRLSWTRATIKSPANFWAAPICDCPLGHCWSDLRAGSFQQPVTGQLDSAGDQSRRFVRGAGIHQHAEPATNNFWRIRSVP